MTYVLRPFLVLLSVVSIGCAEMQAEQYFSPTPDQPTPPSPNPPGPQKPDRPFCEYKPVEFNLDVTLEGLTLDDSNGNSGSFSGSHQNISIGLDFTIHKAKTTYSMNLTSFKDGTFIPARKNSTKTDIDFSFRAAYNGVGGGLSVKALQSLAEIAGHGLKETMKVLKNEVAKKAQPWETQIFDESSELPGIEYSIPISRSSGAKVGDKFDVYNFTPNWHGTTPCDVDSYFTRDNYRKVATVRLKNIGVNMATVEVIQKHRDEKIIQTAQVLQHRDNSRKLLRAVRVGNVESLGLIYVSNKDPIDFARLMRVQIPTLLSEAGLYLK